jgi:hypothetical protein
MHESTSLRKSRLTNGAEVHATYSEIAFHTPSFVRWEKDREDDQKNHSHRRPLTQIPQLRYPFRRKGKLRHKVQTEPARPAPSSRFGSVTLSARSKLN